MNRVTITAIISIVYVVMLCIGFGILFIPMVVEYLIWRFPYYETVIEALDSPLMVSTLPTLSSALLVLGLAGLGVHGLLKNKLDLQPIQSSQSSHYLHYYGHTNNLYAAGFKFS